MEAHHVWMAGCVVICLVLLAYAHHASRGFDRRWGRHEDWD